MPVYMRKRQDSLDLTKFEDAAQDIDEDFITDPDKFRDLLPQPYRLVDKVIESLLERSFQEIFVREEERQTEQTRYKPPIVPTDLCRQVKDVSEVKFLTDSADEKFVFCSASNRLIALNAVSMATAAQFECSDLEISFISVARLSEDLYLLATLDDFGLARIFLFDSVAFHLVKILNEEEGEKKLLCLALQLADGAEFVALTLQNASTQQVSLEFLRLPTDAWSKELEQQAGRAPPPKGTVSEEKGPAGGAEDPEESGAAGNSDDASRQPQLKMAPPAAALRVRPPAAVASTAAVPSFKSVDIAGSVVGSGGAHLLTQQHLQLREAHFQSMHAADMEQLPQDSWQAEATVPMAHVMFVSPGRQFGHDAAGAAADGRVCGVAVAWSGDHRVQLYSLLRAAKDPEIKADAVWTFSCAVTCLAASPCRSLLAVGLRSGVLCLHDAHLGLARHVTCVACDSPIASVFFFNPEAAACGGGGDSGSAVYATQRRVQVAACTADLRTFLIDASPDATPTARLLRASARHEFEATQFVEKPRSHPNLLLRATRSGAIVLHDVALQKEILQFVLAPPHQMPAPWQAGSWSLAANGRRLVMRGVCEDSGEDALFYYDLKILIPMAPYWKQQRPELACFVHPHLQQRVDAFLRLRIDTHTARQKEISEMWARLSETLNEVEKNDEEAESPRTVLSMHTEASNGSQDSRAAKLKLLLLREASGASLLGR